MRGAGAARPCAADGGSGTRGAGQRLRQGVRARGRLRDDRHPAALAAARQFRLGGSLPLQLCDLAWPAAVVALWTLGRRSFALTYYWGLTLSVQGLITPALNNNDFPDVAYLGFFGMHLMIVWAAVYLTWGLGMRPDWGSYRFASAVTAIWAVATFVFNLIAGTNYGYLNEKPGTGSVLDLMGPWPWYILVEAAIILLGWALVTWPWTRADRAREAAR
ncbi:TIGR02206 family membrane protein [Actinomadura madurae]|uniref:YwaF family protein n=1 Tax=Actinomadura madurae TaxID=1993 RepID=UPI0020D217B3|nr:TIGR02206 family membrane protein [Actinomadura madurae]MCP9968141.1 TIGR02206 family membrane protein [Actinomadura madurae]